MANARGVAGVGTGETAQQIGALLSAMTVRRRRKDNVGSAMNGDPRACSNARAARVRSEMQREGGSPHWEGIVALDFCDLEDGVSLEEVNAPHYRAIAANTAHAKATPVTRPVRLVSSHEQKSQNPVDVAQCTLDENDPRSLANLIAAIDQYQPKLTELRSTAEHRLVVITTQPRHVVGGRRGSLALHS